MYQLEVVSPQGIIFEGDVEQTVINTSDGEIGILENHMLLLTNVVPGKLRIERPEKEAVEFAVTYGTIDVRGDRVIVLVEEAFPIDEIDTEREKKILEEAKAKLEHRETLSLEEIEQLERLRERAEILLELAGVKIR
ncbi:MAG: ATP synthase F1 subunit epsilon [Aquificae bacterium]|nr:ATP synthase F1 subunit epsilon [Aquificota bacterium]